MANDLVGENICFKNYNKINFYKNKLCKKCWIFSYSALIFSKTHRNLSFVSWHWYHLLFYTAEVLWKPLFLPALFPTLKLLL